MCQTTSIDILQEAEKWQNPSILTNATAPECWCGHPYDNNHPHVWKDDRARPCNKEGCDCEDYDRNYVLVKVRPEDIEGAIVKNVG